MFKNEFNDIWCDDLLRPYKYSGPPFEGSFLQFVVINDSVTNSEQNNLCSAFCSTKCGFICFCGPGSDGWRESINWIVAPDCREKPVRGNLTTTGNEHPANVISSLTGILEGAEYVRKTLSKEYFHNVMVVFIGKDEELKQRVLHAVKAVFDLENPNDSQEQ